MTFLTRRTQLLRAASLLLLATTTAVAPAQERHLSSVMIVRCGPTDIRLNKHLLEALLWEPPVVDNLKERFGKDFTRIDRMQIGMPAEHGAGTYQVHLHCSVTVTSNWTAESRKQATDVFVDHLKKRLNEILYVAPVERLSARRDQLRQRHLDNQRRLLELEATLEQDELERSHAHVEYQALSEQLLQVKLAVATEEQVRAHLAQARDKNTDLREHLRKEADKAKRERNDLEEQLITIRSERNLSKTKEAEVDKKIERLKGQLVQIDNGIARWQELGADVQNMLTILLEQLPNCELALQRARAEMASIEDSLTNVRNRCAKAEARKREQTKDRMRIAQLQVDIQVNREQLLEVEGQLARLRPVRYETLTPR